MREFWALAIAVAAGACASAKGAAPAPDAHTSTVEVSLTEPDAAPDESADLAADTSAVDAAPDVAADVPADVSADSLPDAADSDTDAENDAGGVCFKGAPPAADAFVVDLPPPATADCATPFPASWFAGPTPAPTLSVIPGYASPPGSFLAYTNLGWAPIFYGNQGGFHLWGGFKVNLPSGTPSQLKVDVQIWGENACNVAASGLSSLADAEQLTDGSYSNIFSGAMGIPAQFNVPAANSGLYCGQWVVFHIRVHVPTTEIWGEGVVTVRIYDSKKP